MTAKITEAELENFRTDLELLKATRDSARKLEELVKARELDLIARLDAGAEVDSERLTAVVDRSEERRIIPWKEVARSLWKQLKLDPDVMETRTKDLTKPNIYPHVVVTERKGGLG